MIDQTQAGTHCYTVRFIRTVKGDLPSGSSGAVVHTMENLGRRLILVHWDSGITVPVFPDEIVLESQDSLDPCEKANAA
jgi:hypothetical protein